MNGEHTSIVTIDEVDYHLYVHEPAHPNWHYHDEPHADGSPGQPQHHHCDSKCENRTALLVPVAPVREDWTVNGDTPPDMYRVWANDERLVGSYEEVKQYDRAR